MAKKKTKRKVRTWNLKTKLISRIRQNWQYSPHKALAKKKARVPGSKSVYKCSICGEHETDVEVDHINPIVDVEKGFEGYDKYIRNTFGGQLHVKPEERETLDVSFLRVLCIPCHTEVTSVQTAMRKKFRKNRK